MLFDIPLFDFLPHPLLLGKDRKRPKKLMVPSFGKSLWKNGSTYGKRKIYLHTRDD